MEGDTCQKLRRLLTEPTSIVAVGFSVKELTRLFGLDDTHVVDAARLVTTRPMWENLPHTIVVDVSDVIASGSADAAATLLHVSCFPRTFGRRVVLSCESVLDAGAPAQTTADCLIAAPRITRAFLNPPALLCHDYLTGAVQLLEDPDDVQSM